MQISATEAITKRNIFDTNKNLIVPKTRKKSVLFLLDDGEEHSKMLEAAIRSLDPSIEIRSCKIIYNGFASVSEIQNFLKEVVEYKIMNPSTVVVVNCSWSTGQNYEIEKSLQSCIQHDVFVVCALGDESVENKFLPSTVDGVYTVGGLNKYFKPNKLSNYGNVDFYVYSNEVAGMSGSSMSAALTSAMICMLGSFVKQEKIKETLERCVAKQNSIPVLIWPFAFDEEESQDQNHLNLDLYPETSYFGACSILQKAKDLQNVLQQEYLTEVKSIFPLKFEKRYETIVPFGQIPTTEGTNFDIITKFENFEISKTYKVTKTLESEVSDVSEDLVKVALHIKFSDRRLKNNIETSLPSGELIDKINVVQWDWKGDGEHVSYGLIAQELEELLPEAVYSPIDETQMMGIYYEKLVPLLIKELQEQRARIEELENVKVCMCPS